MLENNAILVLAIPIAIVLPLAIAFLINTPRPRLAVLPLGVLPADGRLVGRDRRSSRGASSTRQAGDPAAPARTTSGLGFLHPDMLSHEHSALIAVMITFIWSMFGTNLIIFLAGMATIDQEIYDAARVDGAGQFTVLFRITFPLLKRFVQFAFIISLITAFSALFSLIYRDDERRAGLRHDDARVLHLPAGVHREQLRRGRDRRRRAVRRVFAVSACSSCGCLRSDD